MAFSANRDQPILLASNLQAATTSATPVFRGQEPDNRTPRQQGSIVSIEDGVASIDLGSVDGLAKGFLARHFGFYFSHQNMRDRSELPTTNERLLFDCEFEAHPLGGRLAEQMGGHGHRRFVAGFFYAS